MADQNYQRFAKLNFDGFRELAKDETLSKYERIGFPDSYRQGKEALIYEDILQKLPSLQREGTTILDVGPGCSELPNFLIKNAETLNQRLLLVDSEEMLALLPESNAVKKVAAYYPQCPDLFAAYTQRVDALLVYSVLHYIFAEGNIWEFLDKSLSLLAPKGAMLIGDIPNVSKRKRFFSSDNGIKFHQEFTNSPSVPQITFNQIEEQQIDDAVILSLLARARNQGFDAYVVPQPSLLPMANRREDILIIRP